MRHRLVAVSLLAVHGCAAPADERLDVGASRTCGWTDTVRLTATGVADLQLRTSVTEVKARCNVLRDTIVPGSEGSPQRQLHVEIGGAELIAEVALDSVWRLRVTDSRLRTASGLGVGSLVSELLASGVAWAGSGEGAIFVGLTRECGLSFALDHGHPGMPPYLAPRGVTGLRGVPPDTPVAMVLAVGRNGHCPAPSAG